MSVAIMDTITVVIVVVIALLLIVIIGIVGIHRYKDRYLASFKGLHDPFFRHRMSLRP